jgi:D-lactate dehydrogenase (cytochrome)
MTATAPAYPRAAIPRSLLDGLAALAGERLTTGRAVCEAHGRDESFHPAVAPDAVVFAESTEEVAAVVRLCARHKVPVIPFGVGTSLEGHVAALHGGVCIDLSRMNAVIEVNQDDLDCRVQAGVTRRQLNEYLRDTGMFFPIDPGADATIGGMAATRASGTNAVRYGTMKENVLGLTAVTASGEVIRTGGRARKSAAGYDLTRLLVGSEGTLAVITEVQLRLYGIPEAMSAAVCAFPSLKAAVDTVIETIQSGIPVARVELLEKTQMGAVISFSKLAGYKPADTLFFEFHGSAASVAEQAEAVGAIAREQGGEDFKWATRAEERSALWQARHEAYYAALSLRPGCKGWPTDVCVPISRLADCITETKADIDASGIMAPIVGHVGDGNFHLVFLIDPESQDELARAGAVNERMVARALAMGGTCTGEHGIGYGKIGCLEQEHGPAVEMMRTIKRALDPDNLMNPGKVLRV